MITTYSEDIVGTDEKLGITALDSLRAEDEPWLFDVLEPPPEFDLVRGPRSTIVFGGAGSGKSAICRVLKQLAQQGENGKPRLLVEWRPRPPKATSEISTELVDEQLREILDLCAEGTLTYLAYHPAAFTTAPSWAQHVLAWFVRTHLRGDLELRSGQLRSEVDELGTTLLDQLAGWPVREVLDAEAAPEYVIRELIKALEKIEINGVWVLVDDLDIWTDAAPELLSKGLTAFLSTLALFEQNGFAFKIFLPSELEQFLGGVSGITRRRVGVHYLHWTPQKLENVVLRRLRKAFGCTFEGLDAICEDKTLLTWLERCGGYTPAGWLEYVRPLAAAYLEQLRIGNPRPITKKAWLEIRRRHPPRLSLDRNQRRVRVGERVSKELAEQQFSLFEYLYNRAGMTCTRSELHFLADLKLAHEPVAGEPKYESPNDYSGQLETAIWRLREALEPDPKHPFFIITVKGKGYRLENAFKPSEM